MGISTIKAALYCDSLLLVLESEYTVGDPYII